MTNIVCWGVLVVLVAATWPFSLPTIAAVLVGVAMFGRD